MNLEEKIVAYAVELRTAQKRRLACPDGAAKDAAGHLELVARKKLNEFVDLYLHAQAKVEAVEPLKER
jgi:hypothetical protein